MSLQTHELTNSRTHELKNSNNMKPQQTLNIIFYTCIGLSLLTALLFETNTLIGGWWADNRSADFLCTAILELLSLCAIPVAFRLVRPGHSNTGRMSYDCRAILRLVLLGLPLLLNTFAYYAFMGVPFGYMAIILFLCLLFVAPTRNRYEREKASLQTTDSSSENA